MTAAGVGGHARAATGTVDPAAGGAGPVVRVSRTRTGFTGLETGAGGEGALQVDDDVGVL